MYHNPKDQEDIFSSDFEDTVLNFSPEELRLLQLLAEDRIRFMKQEENVDIMPTESDCI